MLEVGMLPVRERRGGDRITGLLCPHDSQGVLDLVRKTKVHYSFRNRTLLLPVLSQVTLIQALLGYVSTGITLRHYKRYTALHIDSLNRMQIYVDLFIAV
jgi:hypothetical protein